MKGSLVYETKGTYDHIKCNCCAVPLEEHTDECFRHRHLTGAIAERKAVIAIQESEKQRNGHTNQLSSAAKAMSGLLERLRNH